MAAAMCHVGLSEMDEDWLEYGTNEIRSVLWGVREFLEQQAGVTVETLGLGVESPGLQ